LKRKAQLPLVVQTGASPRGFFGGLHRRQKHTGDNGDHGNHHQQFNKRKPAPTVNVSRIRQGASI
jgi:hypothetical protein